MSKQDCKHMSAYLFNNAEMKIFMANVKQRKNPTKDDKMNVLPIAATPVSRL